MLITCSSSLSTIDSIRKSTLWYVMLTSEFCFERIFDSCSVLVYEGTRVERHIDIFD